MKLLCVDFSNLVVRHGSNPYGTHKDAVGRPVSGAVGAVSQVLRLMSSHAPTHLLIARDSSRSQTFRRELSPEYKAHRADADEDMVRNFALAYQAVDILGLPCVSADGYEADDVIASACKRFAGRCEVISGDKDLLALCSERVTVWLFRPGGPEAINVAGCQRILGVEPRQVRDYKALVGDTSDGISGITGIGPKSAVKLLEAYGSVAGMYRHLDSGGTFEGVVTPAIQRKVEAGREQARLSWQLAGLVESLDIDVDALALGARPNWVEHADALTRIGLTGLQNALGGGRPQKPTGQLDLDLVFDQL